MEFIGPSGSFYLREIKRPLLFLAGGTGLAPFLSMLGTLALTGVGQPDAPGLWRHQRCRSGRPRALEDYAARIPGFTFATCVAAEASAHPRKGYVTAHIAPAHLHGGEVDVYLCGPPPMVDAVRGWLAEEGVAPANFYYEKFSPSGAVTASARRTGRRLMTFPAASPARPPSSPAPRRASAATWRCAWREGGRVALVDRSALVEEVRQEAEAGGAEARGHRRP